MTVIRTIAVGLAIAAYLVVSYAAEFMHWAQNSLALYTIVLANHVLAPSTGQMAGDSSYLPAAFVLGCVAVGLFSSSLLWPRIESFITAPFRIIQGIQAKRAELRYLAEAKSSQD